MDLFLCAKFKLDRLIEVGGEAPHNDSMLRGAASINFEKEEKDMLSKKIWYSSNILGTHTSRSFLSSTGLQQSRDLSGNLFNYMSRYSPTSWRIRLSLARQNLAST